MDAKEPPVIDDSQKIQPHSVRIGALYSPVYRFVATMNLVGNDVYEKVLRQSNLAGTSMPIGSMYAIHGNICHLYTPNVSIYTTHGSYGMANIPYMEHLG